MHVFEVNGLMMCRADVAFRFRRGFPGYWKRREHSADKASINYESITRFQNIGKSSEYSLQKACATWLYKHLARNP